nr:fasciclin-like arabinogalactan protein 17 [Ipomoea batatas]GMC86179.1 fasciclin-like arabinogalactan protein 17 [Ipomoea batatas]GME17394.1 fasciclin-like arabinogalactan protein 17 [Ipomoea batatas]GME19239.1 fasciclin-like arabinogalactan protein 17 [Ipomoea batatas]
MDSQIYGLCKVFAFLAFFFCPALTGATLQENPPGKGGAANSAAQINSNSVLVALLDSHYTELSELVEKALLLQTLEEAVSRHNITIFAPRNEALERDLDPEFKRFLLEPGNLRSLQNLLLFHMIPTRIEAKHWSRAARSHPSLCRAAGDENLAVAQGKNGEREVSAAKVVRADDIVRPDGVIHGIERVLIPQSVQQDFNTRRSLRSISAVLPTGAPEVDPRTHRLKKPAPVKDFIQTLLHYGGYNELADIMVNLTSLATEMGRLVSQGYVLTVLAPNDEAMAKLTTDQLSEPGAPEQIMYYHLIPEYQTEESMYNAVRRFGKIRYDTLRLPHKVVAEEADGSVKFGHGEGSAYLFDPDIYTDGRISVQGIDGVLFPPEATAQPPPPKPTTVAKVVSKPRRGMVL